ncbi:MAG TPA: PEP-CTERM sorting domain-containing protein [Terriglobales bacterium]|nr:PEP-CTERM sorting domain-containing protein [Terriglobales bacterium]
MKSLKLLAVMAAVASIPLAASANSIDNSTRQNGVAARAGVTLTAASSTSTIRESRFLSANGSLSRGSGAATWASTETFAATAVPEPGTMALLGTGLVGLAATFRRKILK